MVPYRERFPRYSDRNDILTELVEIYRGMPPGTATTHVGRGIIIFHTHSDRMAGQQIPTLAVWRNVFRGEVMIEKF